MTAHANCARWCGFFFGLGYCNCGMKKNLYKNHGKKRTPQQHKHHQQVSAKAGLK